MAHSVCCSVAKIPKPRLPTRSARRRLGLQCRSWNWCAANWTLDIRQSESTCPHPQSKFTHFVSFKPLFHILGYLHKFFALGYWCVQYSIRSWSGYHWPKDQNYDLGQQKPHTFQHIIMRRVHYIYTTSHQPRKDFVLSASDYLCRIRGIPYGQYDWRLVSPTFPAECSHRKRCIRQGVGEICRLGWGKGRGRHQRFQIIAENFFSLDRIFRNLLSLECFFRFIYHIDPFHTAFNALYTPHTCTHSKIHYSIKFISKELWTWSPWIWNFFVLIHFSIKVRKVSQWKGTGMCQSPSNESIHLPEIVSGANLRSFE